MEMKGKSVGLLPVYVILLMALSFAVQFISVRALEDPAVAPAGPYRVGDTITLTGAVGEVPAGSSVEVYWDYVIGPNAYLLNTTTGSLDGSYEVQIDVPETTVGDHYIWVLYTATGMTVHSGAITVIESESPHPSGEPYVCTFFYPWYGHYTHWEDGQHTPPGNWSANYLPDTIPDTFDPANELYDSKNVSTIHWQLELMKRAGIRASVSSWWGIDTYEDQALDKILDEVMTAPDCPYRDLKWCIYYEPEGYGDPTVDEICDDLTYIAENYGDLPYYWKIDGKIVVFVWADGSDSGDYALRWNQVRERLGNVYTVLKVFGGYTSYSDHSDSWHQYAPALRYESQGSYSAFASPGFWAVDETPRLSRDLAAFEQAVQDLNNSGCAFLMIQTWNEWHEGTQVEPGQPIDPTATPYLPTGDSYGYDYIDAIARNLISLEPSPVSVEFVEPFNNSMIFSSTVTVRIKVKDPYTDNLTAFVSVDGGAPREMVYAGQGVDGFHYFEDTSAYTFESHRIVVFTKDEFDYFSDNHRLDFTARGGARERVVVFLKGAFEPDAQLTAVMTNVSWATWSVIYDDLTVSDLVNASMLIMVQSDSSLDYTGAELNAVASWLTEGNKTIWVAGDSDYGSDAQRQETANALLEHIGSSLRVESASIEDPVSNGGAPYRVLAVSDYGDPEVDFLVSGVQRGLFHGPGAIIGYNDGTYHKLEESGLENVYVVMTTSESGIIIDQNEPPPEVHQVGDEAAFPVMAMEFDDAKDNVIIASGDAPFGQYMGLYKPELQRPDRYGPDANPQQGGRLFENIVDYAIQYAALLGDLDDYPDVASLEPTVLIHLKGGLAPDIQQAAAMSNVSWVDWSVVYGDISASDLTDVSMLIMIQADSSLDYIEAELAAVKAWFDTGNKAVWVAADSDYGTDSLRQATANSALKYLGSALHVEQCSIEDPVSNGFAPYRVLAVSDLCDPEFTHLVSGVDRGLFHAPGALVGRMGDAYYTLDEEFFEDVYVIMTTSVNGVIVDNSEPSPEIHGAGDEGAFPVMALEVDESKGNVIIATGDAPFGQYTGLYKPELKRPDRYGPDANPQQGGRLFENVIDYFIQYSSRLIDSTVASDEWSFSLNTSIGIYQSDSILGVRYDATGGFDTEVGDQLVPPPPTLGVTSYFYYPDNPTGYVDYRKLSTSYHPVEYPTSWMLKVATISVSGLANISWASSEIAAIPEDYFIRLWTPTDTVDMRDATSYAWTADADTTYTFNITVTSEVEFTLNLKAGWNMVSLPVVPEDTSALHVLSGVGFYQLVAWSGTGYVSVSSFEAGKGYWLLVLQDTNVTVSGEPVSSVVLDLQPGWSMVGGLYSVVQAEDVFPGFYQLVTWSGTGYVTATEFEPGRGYWALVLEETQIRLP